tara:strand:+ start:132 stop:272 length:141 start_codon:yes stop_codon:yes gene_type:complete
MKKEKIIQIVVQGGVVIDVKNLPDGHVVQIIDKDCKTGYIVKEAIK